MDLLSVGTSGWSYPTWRPGFYPAGLANEDFLGFYAERFRTVELNTTGYRLPSEEQFARWAAQAPPGFSFAPKLPQRSLRSLGTFEERVSRLDDRLGPVRVVVESPRDDGLLALLLGSTGLRLALDLRDPSWDEVDVRPAVRVGDWDADAAFRYLRFREPPYGDAELDALAAQLVPVLGSGAEVFAYFQHEDEPTAPAYAGALLERIAAAAADSR